IARLACPIGAGGITSKWPAAIAVGVAFQLLREISAAAPEQRACLAQPAEPACAGACADCRPPGGARECTGRCDRGDVPARLAGSAASLAAPGRRHRLDRCVVLFRLARQSPAIPERPRTQRPGRGRGALGGAWRWLLSLAKIPAPRARAS